MTMDLLDKPAAKPAAEPPSAPAAPSAVEALLGEGRKKRTRSLAGLALGALMAAGLAGGGWLAWRHFHPAPALYETAPARRGDLNVVVTVTGNIAPVDQVDVSSEISGTVTEVRVQENDRVRKGQVLAIIDPSRLRDQISQGEAALATARANLLQAQATVHENGLTASRLHQLLDRGGFSTRADVDTADAALERARAAEAAAEAAILQAQAGLNTSRTNLAKAAIRSPVDGVVLTKKVEVGQTVAAALQAPVLFTLAQDMSRMELDVDVDEADVGEVKQGQAATFTVDAYPSREYAARVTRVDYGSQIKDGVVTYTGVLSVDNSDLSLRPGMTASADIRTASRHDVLLVPDAALRFTPSAPKNGPTAASALVPRMPRLGAGPVRRSTDPNAQQVWVLKAGRAVPTPVKIGPSDGRETEIRGGALASGDPVIVAEAAAK